MSAVSSSSESDLQSYEELVAINLRLQQEIELYRHRYEELRRKLFGRSSEQRHVIDRQQQHLFDPAQQLPLPPTEDEHIEVGTHKRKRKSKKEFPADLPVDEIIYEPTETHCEDCGGELAEFSRDVREEIEYNPASFFRRQHITVHCSCPRCASGVKSGVIPPENQPVIPGAQVGPSFLAHVMVSKHCDHIPYYRQSQMYEREGVFFPDKTLSRYGMRVGELFEPVAKEIKRVACTLEYIQADETRLRVLDREKDSNAHTGQLWVMRSPCRKSPLILYEYHQGRGKEDAKEFLGKYEGALQTDALASYNDFTGIRIGCMAHARRYFVEAKPIATKESAHMLKLIGQLYKIESDLKKELPKYQKKKKFTKWLNKREQVRQERAVPILDKMNEYLKLLNPRCLLESHPLTKAVNYMLNRFYQFCVYVTDGSFEIDNNLVEQAIRPVAIGRKNWLFCGSHDGAKMAAVMMTVIHTCKLRGINPHQYITDVLPRLAHQSTTSLKGLTPLDWEK